MNRSLNSTRSKPLQKRSHTKGRKTGGVKFEVVIFLGQTLFISPFYYLRVVKGRKPFTRWPILSYKTFSDKNILIK